MGAQEQEQKWGLPPGCKEATGKRHFLRLLRGHRSRSPLFSGWGGQEGEVTSWPAQVSRRLILENRWDSLWYLGSLNPQPGLGDFVGAWAGVQPPRHSPGSFPSQGCAHATSSS